MEHVNLLIRSCEIERASKERQVPVHGRFCDAIPCVVRLKPLRGVVIERIARDRAHDLAAPERYFGPQLPEVHPSPASPGTALASGKLS